MTRDPSSADHPERGSAPAQGQDQASAPAEGFLDRWSRRKHSARQEAQAAPAPPATQPQPEPPPVDREPPDLASLDGDSDYSAFFSPKVSEELRRLALRKLFGASKFNLRDGLDDYDDDYRSFEALGDIVTADMRRQRERERQSAMSPASNEAPSPAGEAGETGADETEQPLAAAEVEPVDGSSASETSDGESEQGGAA